MKKIKKIAAGLMAVTAMATSMTGISASAIDYTFKSSWRTYLVLDTPQVPNQQSYTNCSFPCWGRGYYSYCSTIEGNNNRLVLVESNTTDDYNITTTGYSDHIDNTVPTSVTFTFTGVTSNYINASGSVGYADYY